MVVVDRCEAKRGCEAPHQHWIDGSGCDSQSLRKMSRGLPSRTFQITNENEQIRDSSFLILLSKKWWRNGQTVSVGRPTYRRLRSKELEDGRRGKYDRQIYPRIDGQKLSMNEARLLTTLAQR